MKKTKVLEGQGTSVIYSQTLGQHCQHQSSNNEGPPILQNVVKNAIRKSRIGKAHGEYGITTEMVKTIGQFGIE